MHLRTKVTNMFVVVSVLPLILMAALGIYFMNLTQRTSVYELERQLIAQKEKEIENFLSITSGILEIKLAEDRPSLASFNVRELDNIASLVISTNKNLAEVAFINYNAARPHDETAGKEIVRYARGGYIDPTNYPSHRNEEGFIAALQGNISYAPIERINDELLLPVYIPLHNRDNTVIGVSYGKINIAPIKRLMFDAKLGEEGYTYLTDEQNGVFFSSLEKPIHVSAGAQDFAKNILSSRLLKTIFDTDSEFIGSHNAVPVLASGKHIKPLNAALIVEWPKADAMNIVYSSISRGTIFTAIVLILVISLSIFFVRTIIGPINTLKEGAVVVGQGDLRHVITLETGDELEELAHSFNTMARSLAEVQDLRESKIIAQGLKRSLEKEQELSKVKDTFIATASHQLRTPISVIRWISESLVSVEDPRTMKDMRDQIRDLYENSAKISLIISDLLTVSELGLNYKPSDVTKIDLAQKIHESLERYEADIDKKQLVIEHEMGEQGQYTILANGLAMRRVLENLIDNAVTYSHEKSTISIRLTHEEGRVVCSIQDHGIGIPDDEKQFIFGEFFRARNSVEKKNVGTGLGLFIVKTIIKGHRGETGFDSKQNEGTTFWFKLPKGQ